MILLAFVFVTGSGGAAVATSDCTHPCTTGSQSVSRTGSPPSTPCIRDVGCGGGALGSSISVVAVVLVVIGAAALGGGIWRRRTASVRTRTGRLLTGGLFRPPRALLAF